MLGRLDQPMGHVVEELGVVQGEEEEGGSGDLGQFQREVLVEGKVGDRAVGDGSEEPRGNPGGLPAEHSGEAGPDPRPVEQGEEGKRKMQPKYPSTIKRSKGDRASATADEANRKESSIEIEF